MRKFKAIFTILLILILVKPGLSNADFWSLDFEIFKKINSINYIEVVNNTKETALNNNLKIVNANSIFPHKNPVTPRTHKNPIQKTYIVLASAYSSTFDQTDRTPFITASGIHVRPGVVAANFLPLGTVIKIPDLYGEETFVVEDRMNGRYQYNIDIWFDSREKAKEFGVKRVRIELI